MKTSTFLVALLICNLLLAPNLYAQTATVMGKITRHNQPAANVIVSIGDKFSVTDAQGRYLIKDVPFGRPTLRIKENKQGGQVLREVDTEVRQPRLVQDEVIP